MAGHEVTIEAINIVPDIPNGHWARAILSVVPRIGVGPQLGELVTEDQGYVTLGEVATGRHSADDERTLLLVTSSYAKFLSPEQHEERVARVANRLRVLLNTPEKFWEKGEEAEQEPAVASVSGDVR
jgi:hypothetical protein